VRTIGENETWAAIAVWAAVFAAMLTHLFRTLLLPKPDRVSAARTPTPQAADPTQ